MLATASGDQSIRIWDLCPNVPALKMTLRGHMSSVKTVKFRNGSNVELVSGAREGNIFLWDTRAPNSTTRFECQVCTASHPIALQFNFLSHSSLCTPAAILSSFLSRRFWFHSVNLNGCVGSLCNEYWELMLRTQASRTRVRVGEKVYITA